jgi:hypothetical protein
LVDFEQPTGAGPALVPRCRHDQPQGRAEPAGPDDPQPWLADADQLRLLLRAVFTAAGGRHGNWAEYDRVMAEQRRTAVLIDPNRIYSNG